MIIKTSGFRGVPYFQTHPFRLHCSRQSKSDQVVGYVPKKKHAARSTKSSWRMSSWRRKSFRIHQTTGPALRGFFHGGAAAMAGQAGQGIGVSDREIQAVHNGD